MTINLMSQEDHDVLLKLYENYPGLTYENKGWDNPNQSLWDEPTHKAFNKVNEILKKYIHGFNKFQNFRDRGEPQLRFQYIYDTRTGFTGVGYIMLSELKDGFKTKEDGKE